MSDSAGAAPRTPPPSLIRPVGRRWRFLHAYFVTFQVLLSYLLLSFQSRYRSAAAIEALTLEKHLVNARRIERAIGRLQGLFIKIGQLISIMSNFLPEEFRAQLAGLQDQVPARPFVDIQQRIREEFGGRGPREIFAEFVESPVASASIGQVHMAVTREGERVAVKVQYPDIEEIVRINLKTLKHIFAALEWFMPHHGLGGVLGEIRAMILQELDFRREADNIERIAANFPGRTDVGFPAVKRALSTSRVLTTEWIEGVKMNDRARLDALGIDKRRLARTVVAAYCQQIFTDGVYHANPHPGNLLVLPPAASLSAGASAAEPGPAALAAPAQTKGEPRVIFLDFGAVAEVSPTMRRGIVELIQASISRDTPGVIQAMKDMGFISRGADPALFDRVVDYLHEKFQEDVRVESFSLKDIKFDPQRGLERLADLRKMDVSLRDLADHFHVPKEWIMLERTVLLLVGLCTELDRELNPMEVIRPYLEEFVLGKDRDISAFVVDTTKELGLSLVSLPGELKRFITRSMRGELEIRFKGVDEHAQLLYVLGHQLLYAGLGVASAAFWLILDGHGRVAESVWAGRASVGFGVLLLWSFFANRSSTRKRRR